ncbi:MAG: hypothetical protein ACE14L_01065 [Terriglobales bacterium]
MEGSVQASLVQIERKIQTAVDAIVRSIVDTDDGVAGTVVGRNTTAHLLISSSFLYRDKSIRTTQSSKRLVARISASGRHGRLENIGVLDNQNLRTHYKVIPQPTAADLVPLRSAVTQETASVGDLLFILIGTVEGLRPQTQDIRSNKVKKIRLVPSLNGAQLQRTETGVYSIRKIVPIEELFQFIDGDLQDDGGLSGEDRRVIGAAYDEMLDGATTEVSVPTGDVAQRNDTVLGKMVASLRAQAAQYQTAISGLRNAPDDAHALNEVLRIAYNFSADVLPLISLFVSICDLKPLVFWCTIKEQWALHRAFASLPWSALGRKEKLEEYKAIVSQARSHAFHHVLPFDSTVEIDLSALDVRAETIRLFVPFGQKQGRGVHLKDQKLADVLAEFSRARERPVSQVFWEANLAVMQTACKLAEEVLGTLILIHNARRETSAKA